VRILAVDDEPIALDGLVTSISEAAPDAEVRGFSNVSDAVLYAMMSHPEIAFLDINLRADSGIDLAKRLKEIDPQINIIFTTGHRQYMEQAFEMHASGYVVKPVTVEKISHELSNLRAPVEQASAKRVRVKTFGDFELFVDEKPVQFGYSRTKEIIAYLVDCRGSMCTNGRLIDVLWEDDDAMSHRSYFGNLLADLLKTLKDYDCEDIIIRRRGQIGIDITKIDCDYYDWLEGDPKAREAFAGEYMAQYSWGEMTLGSMFFNE
jgi:two-component SAPR family response regulator